LRQCRLIYLLGGFPHYLAKTLAGSLSWQAMREAHDKGAVIGGSSAGAMVLCQHYYDPDTRRIMDGLNLLSQACVIPHHDSSGKKWAPFLVGSVPDDAIIGVHEQTGLIDDGAKEKWTVFGKGIVTIYKKGLTSTYHSSETFSLR